MLTPEDIQKLIEVFATKEDFSSFRDEYRNDFANMQVAVDNYAKKGE